MLKHILPLSAAVTLWLAAPGMAHPASANPRILSGEPGAAVQCYEEAARAHVRPAAVDTCTAALEADPDTETRAATLTNRALINRRLGHTEAAAEDCRASLNIGPAGPAAAVTCAAAFIEAGTPAEAIALLEASPEPAPGQRYKRYHNLALAHHDLGQYREAYAWLERTLEAKPGFTPALELKQQYRVVRYPIAK